MLPNLHYQCYQKFAQLLEHLQQMVAVSQPDAQNLRQSFLEVQQFFQQLVSLDTEDLEPSSAARVRSYQTEISKHLRLLEMDMTFLQVARQPETVQERQMQLSDRIQTLQSYCNAMLQTSEGERGSR